MARYRIDNGGTWETPHSFLLAFSKRKDSRTVFNKFKRQGRDEQEYGESEQLIVLNRLPVMGLARGRGCRQYQKVNSKQVFIH